MDVTLEGAQALVAIAEAGSFSAAARRLGKVQSAVSYNVKQLEGALGVALFDRSGHRAQLTSAGRVILGEARLLLSRARRMEALGARLGQGFEPRLQVVVDGAVPMAPLLEALDALGAEDLPTHIQLRTEYLGGVPVRFDELGADLMLSLVPVSGPGWQVVPLQELDFRLMACPEHPAVAQAPLSPSELAHHLELSVHDSDPETWSRDTNLNPGARVFYVGDFAAKREGLVRGLGLGWMPKHLVQSELEAGRLVELAGAGRKRFPLSLCWREDRPLGPVGERLRGALVERLGGHPGSNAR